MSLSDFVSSLPKQWAMAPIYRKGHKLDDGQVCCGKRPMQGAWNTRCSPAQAAFKLQQSPDIFAACGVYAGPRSGGVVIFDVDFNLGQILKKWGADLKGPKVVSPKKNAAKYFFSVPEDLWPTVAGVSHAQSGEGWEVLWKGKQGLLCGDYKTGGSYTPTGDFNALPEAPTWLIGAMQASASEAENSDKNHVKDDRWEGRSLDQKVAIARDCLSVIPPTGRGSNKEWVEIGFMLHDELPNEHGLDLWRWWSKQDPEFAEDWENGNDPCAARWASIKPGRMGFGTLIKLADAHDPKRTRVKPGSLGEEGLNGFEDSGLPSYEDLIERGMKILQQDDTARMSYELHALAQRARYRDQGELERLLIERMSQDSMGELIKLSDIESVKTEYLIPDVVPHPAHILVYGSGGDGKSSACWVLAKHIAEGEPFVVRGQLMPVKKGPVLILNGDQPLHLLKEQTDEAGLSLSDCYVVNNWNLQSYARFTRLVQKVKPALIVVDSLIGCSGSKAFDENKSDFATPLYWLTRNNGSTFPATTIMMIHHANKQGGFRGTSAIRDAVDETWALKKPTDEQLDRGELLPHHRLINIEKSRSGRSGTSLLMRQEDDLTFSVTDFTPEVDAKNTAPSAIIDRVLHRLRTCYPRIVEKEALLNDPLIGGKPAAVTKALQRLVKRELITATKAPGRHGKVSYQAVLARGEKPWGVHSKQKPAAGTDLREDSVVHSEQVVHPSPASGSVGGQDKGSEQACPPSEASAGAASALVGQPGEYPHAREGYDPDGDWDA